MILKIFFIQCVVWGFANCLNNETSYRLPTNVIPEDYTLNIITLFDDVFKFNGHVDIETKCVEPTNLIYLHSKNLTIEDKDVAVNDITKKQKLDITKISYDNDKAFLIIHLKEPLEKDHKYMIGIKFEGKLGDSLNGYYRSHYLTKSGEKRWLAITQFEPTEARKAFPCFDEPSMKATFKISLGREKIYNSLSNMPLLETKPIVGMPGWYWDIYQKSVPMSTYLVAFMVSDFGYATSPLKDLGNNVTFNIWARKEALGQVDLANHVGPKALAFYEDFYNLDFPLPKQDMVAIPDFSAGAMENWGLITYRETALLYDEHTSTTQSRHRVASVIAHELAHQWFGNLVTMRWWTDLWLNEGFATYMAALAVDDLYPEWHSYEESVVESALSVFQIDALKSSHPVSVKINDPALISEIFDTVAYQKGSFLIRMMSLFLGEKSLKEGVNDYLQKHKFGSADQDDLWESLTSAAYKNKALDTNMTVKTIMDSWTLQTGYPVITVNRNYEDGSAYLTQARFLRDRIMAKNSSTSDNCWWIPISFTTEGELEVNRTTPRTWMSCPTQPLKLTGLQSDEWLLLNLQLASLYRINYDEKNWEFLTDTLKSEDFTKIPILNRVQIIDDVSEFAWVGLVKYQLLFDIIGYLKNETEYSPWMTAVDNLNVLDTQIRQSPSHSLFKKYMRQLLGPQFEKLGLRISVDNERLDAVNHQEMIIRKSCQYGIPKCLEDAKKLFTQFMANETQENPVPKDLRRTVYCNGVKEGGENEWNFIWKKFKSSNLGSEKNLLIRALGCTKDTTLLKRFLDLTLQENGIRRQDSSTVFASVVANEKGFEIGKNFLFTKFKEIREFNEGDSKIFNRYLKALSKYMTKQEDYHQFREFLEKNKEKLSEVKQSVEQGIETVELNLQWQGKYQEEISKILEDFSQA